MQGEDQLADMNLDEEDAAQETVEIEGLGEVNVNEIEEETKDEKDEEPADAGALYDKDLFANELGDDEDVDFD